MPFIGNAPVPIQPRMRHTAPTSAPMPIPAVKNSKINNAIPIVVSKYADGGLATVCNSRGTRPSLKKRTVVASRVTCPASSNTSDTVSNVVPRTATPSSAYNMLRSTGTPRSSVENFNTFCSRASKNPKVSECNMSSAVPKDNCVPFTDSIVPVRPMRAPGAIAVTSATASICAGKPYARDPLGPTHTATGIFESEILVNSSAIRSRPITAPLEFNCKMTACEPLF